jgi:hypothetical protein
MKKSNKLLGLITGIVVVLFLVLMSINKNEYRVKVKQQIHYKNICECTYTVDTQLWVYDRWGRIVSLEEHLYDVVHETKLDSIVSVHNKKIAEIKEKINACLEKK